MTRCFFKPDEQRIVSALHGPNEEVLRTIAIQPRRRVVSSKTVIPIGMRPQSTGKKENTNGNGRT